MREALSAPLEVSREVRVSARGPITSQGILAEIYSPEESPENGRGWSKKVVRAPRCSRPCCSEETLGSLKGAVGRPGRERVEHRKVSSIERRNLLNIQTVPRPSRRMHLPSPVEGLGIPNHLCDAQPVRWRAQRRLGWSPRTLSPSRRNISTVCSGRTTARLDFARVGFVGFRHMSIRIARKTSSGCWTRFWTRSVVRTKCGLSSVPIVEDACRNALDTDGLSQINGGLPRVPRGGNACHLRNRSWGSPARTSIATWLQSPSPDCCSFGPSRERRRPWGQSNDSRDGRAL